MLVSNFNIVITIPFTAVLTVSTYGFCNNIVKLVYTTSSGALLPMPIPLVKVLKIPLSDCDLESHVIRHRLVASVFQCGKSRLICIRYACINVTVWG